MTVKVRVRVRVRVRMDMLRENTWKSEVPEADFSVDFQ